MLDYMSSYIEILILRNLWRRPAHGYELRKIRISMYDDI